MGGVDNVSDFVILKKSTTTKGGTMTNIHQQELKEHKEWLEQDREALEFASRYPESEALVKTAEKLQKRIKEIKERLPMLEAVAKAEAEGTLVWR